MACYFTGGGGGAAARRSATETLSTAARRPALPDARRRDRRSTSRRTASRRRISVIVMQTTSSSSRTRLRSRHNLRLDRMSCPVEPHTPHVSLRVLLQVETHSAPCRMRDIRHTGNCSVPPTPSTAGPLRRSSPSSLVRTHKRPPGTSTITGSAPFGPPCPPLWPSLWLPLC